MLIGYLNIPGAWYAQLQKPSFNPPSWIFAPVWSLLYLMIGFVGWRVWCKGKDRQLRGLWLAQMVLNFCWSPAFFGAEKIGLALCIILALLLCVLAFMARAARFDRPSAWLFTPYLAWVGFASVLNAAIFRLNG